MTSLFSFTKATTTTTTTEQTEFNLFDVLSEKCKVLMNHKVNENNKRKWKMLSSREPTAEIQIPNKMFRLLFTYAKKKTETEYVQNEKRSNYQHTDNMNN